MALRVVGSLEGESVNSSGVLSLLRSSAGVSVNGYVADSDIGRLLQQARVVVAKHHIRSALLYQMPDAQRVGPTRKGVSG